MGLFSRSASPAVVTPQVDPQESADGESPKPPAPAPLPSSPQQQAVPQPASPARSPAIPRRAVAVAPQPPTIDSADGLDDSTPNDEPAVTPPPPPVAPVVERNPYFQQMKVRIHQQLVDRLDVQNLKTLPPEVVRREVRVLIRELCNQEKGLLTSADQERLMDEVMDETFGPGRLDTLLEDPHITDILINRFDRG